MILIIKEKFPEKGSLFLGINHYLRQHFPNLSYAPTFGFIMLDFCVRDGNRYFHYNINAASSLPNFIKSTIVFY